jgi:hypothetical protein
MSLAYIKIKLRNYVKGKRMDHTFLFSIQQFQRKWKNKRNKLHITFFFFFALRSKRKKKRKEERLDEL